MPDMNLGKLVPLEVHDKLEITKLAKKILFKIGMMCTLYRWKAKEKSFPTS